jgi:hypothetical protein
VQSHVSTFALRVMYPHTCCVQDLSVDEEGVEEENPSSLRNVNQDMQRALGALGTQEVSLGSCPGFGG